MATYEEFQKWKQEKGITTGVGQEVSPESPIQQATQTQREVPWWEQAAETGGEIASDLGYGVLKGAGSTLRGLSSLAERGVTGITSVVPGLNEALDIGQEKTVAERLIPEEATEAEGITQQIGKGAEQIGEMFIPLGIEKTVVSKLKEIPELAKNAPFLSRITDFLFKTGAKATGTGTEYGAKAYLQSGGDLETAGQTGVISAAVPLASPFLKLAGRKITEAVIPLSAKEAKMIQAYKANTPFWSRVMSGLEGESKAPVTAGKTVFEKGLAGTESMIGVQAKKASNNIWSKIINPALENSKVSQSMPVFWKEVEAKIIKDNPELSRRNGLLKALEALKEDYKGINTATMKDLQNFKEGWAKFVPEKAYRGENIAGNFNDVKNTAAGIARSKLYNNLGPEAKQAYIDYGNLQGIQKLGQKAMTGSKAKGGFGGFWSGIKDMLLTPVGTIGGRVLYKTSEGVEFIGKKGAKTISDLTED